MGDEFDALALAAHDYQYARNEPYRRFVDGRPLLNEVERERGY